MQRIIGSLITASLVSALAACAAQSSGPGVQGRWSLVELDGRPVRPNASGPAPWFAIKGHEIEGHDGCNQFSGRLDKPGSIVSTRRGCAGDVFSLPLNLADPLPQLKAGTVAGEKLVVPPLASMPGFTMGKVP